MLGKPHCDIVGESFNAVFGMDKSFLDFKGASSVKGTWTEMNPDHNGHFALDVFRLMA